MASTVENAEVSWQARVTRVHRGKPLERNGQGFSIPELRQAGLTVPRARTLKLQVDSRRKTSYKANEDLLREVANRTEVSPKGGER